MFKSFTMRRDRTPLAAQRRPEVSLLITTYEKPRHLRLALASVAMQQGVDGRMEVIVTDDGSTDETVQAVERFAQSVDFPVKLTTHRHAGFQVARCRNEGAAVSSAAYLVFIDGDCVIPRDFVARHLQRRKSRVVMFGDAFRLDEDVSAGIDEAEILGGRYFDWVSPAEQERLQRFDRTARWNNLVRHPKKPHLISCNFGIWRSDYERVNGFDENFEGWGQEDDDLGYRLRQVGVRLQSILRWTQSYHVWHPRDATWTADWLDGPNAPYLLRKHRPTRCLNGLIKLGRPYERQSYIVQLLEDFAEPTILLFPINAAERQKRPSRPMAA
jgi:glycosyltransferase involved in cell wall biosynthesis